MLAIEIKMNGPRNPSWVPSDLPSSPVIEPLLNMLMISGNFSFCLAKNINFSF